ncbi:hypothetical protein DFQ30_008182 [Apophysomyces sp. BC1015]|nr:hypothetical protein DFQ30_008182 [Apophysomyces sp. BC1015]
MTGSNDALALVLFCLVMPVFLFFVTPLTSLSSRKHEFEADAFAATQTRAQDLVSALVKLYQDNASTLTPDPVYTAFYYSHPPASQRMSGRAARGAPRRAAATTATAAARRNGHHNAPGNASGVAQGRVIAAHGRHYVVQPEAGGPLLQCFPRGKKSGIAVGDCVSFETTSADQGVIVAIDERHNLLLRSDPFKSKLFAANLDQLLIVLATEPHFSEDLLGRALVAANAHDLEPLIVLNKADITPALPLARSRVAPYAALGYRVIEVSASHAPKSTHATLAPLLADRATLLLGQSGMGKSTLVNLLVPDANAATRAISSVLNSGRHTTTFTRWYALPNGGALIDSPGFQEFGLYHLSEGQLERAFPEFRPWLGGCRFYNCHHLHEPGCAILEALAQGHIAPMRHALYAQLLHEASQVVR